MNHRSASLAVFAAALGALALVSDDARACGGCFHEESQTESTVVTAHRMAFAVSTTHTVLWDQIQYAGSPGSFAWVLPVKPGARVELSTDAWFEALDAATSARVVSPQLDCPGPSGGSSGCGFGCSASSEAGDFRGTEVPPPTVTVVHQGAVGPYETVTLSTTSPSALQDWLTSHGFAVDAGIEPLIDAYVQEGFDFIALRLLPDQGVQQMKPVRVVSPGMSPALPLRMVAAGTGAQVGITLFVIGEGRWQAKGFPNAQVDPAKLIWDFNTDSSNYSDLRQKLLAQDAGRTWNNSYAKRGALLSPVENPTGSGRVQYTVGNQSFETIGEAYVRQGVLNGETQVVECLSAFQTFAGSPEQVVNPCPGGGGGTGGAGAGGTGGAGAGGTGGAGTGGAGAGTGGAGTGAGGAGGGQACGEVALGDLDARELACGALDDVAVALTGLHPRDVWLTRIEANLPRAALAEDLAIEAAPTQVEVENWIAVKQVKNAPCAPSAAAANPGSTRGGDHRRRNQGALFAAITAALAAAIGRRSLRAPLSPARTPR